MKPTEQQRAFLAALVQGKRNILLRARAGCGKTSSILMGVDAYAAAFPDAEIAVCAFNKAIADEVKEKLAARGHSNWRKVSAATIHSMGFGLIKFVFRAKVEEKKVQQLIDQKNAEIYQEYGAQIGQLVKVAKQAGVGFFDDSPIGDINCWFRLADHFGINGLDDTSQMELVVEAAQEIYRLSLAQTDVVDFDDMVLFPLIKNLRVKFGKDLIFLDEAQDLSRARQALAKKFLKRGGRMVIVGDDRQAIYGFSGADAAALENLSKALDAEVLPLSVTWRCPKAIVAKAQTIVPDIKAAPEAPEGTVIYAQELPNDIKVNDAILCRNTAPLIQLAYKLIRQGIAAKVEGRDIGKGLIVMVNRWKVSSIDRLLVRIEQYRDREIQKAMAKDNEEKAEQINDRCDTLVEICNAVAARGGSTVAEVREFIETLFADDAKNAVVLATYHRSKGREWDRVVLWQHAQRCPAKAARQDWQKQQERNLAYVAITRAKQELVFVN